VIHISPHFARADSEKLKMRQTMAVVAAVLVILHSGNSKVSSLSTLSMSDIVQNLLRAMLVKELVKKDFFH
jgi:DMSO/TMAO reductase YedYZ heme-binding membrane subunit